MYVPRGLSEQTAASIAGMKVWLTNEYEHNGLRSSPAVFERLLALRRDLV
jgi:proline iminopeptidase